MKEVKPFEIELKRKYEKSEDFKKYYVTGAIGGFRNPYDFRLTFYNIDSNDFVLKTQNIKSRALLLEKQIKEEVSKYEMRHILQCELIMTERAARELQTFLEKELKILDDIKKKSK